MYGPMEIIYLVMDIFVRNLIHIHEFRRYVIACETIGEPQRM